MQHRPSATTTSRRSHRADRRRAASPSDARMLATIERRLLVNYRVDPAVAARLLPDGLRPQLVRGDAVAGVCLLRMGGLRPAWTPAAVGWGAENAAHRIAVEWDGPDGVERGVYVPMRFSASWVPVALGGRVMPGVHRRATFDVQEDDDRFRVAFDASDDDTDVEVDVDVSLVPASRWTSSLFDDVDEASAFFRDGAVGWSPDHRGRLEGLELRTDAWSVSPGRAHRVHSSFLEGLPRDSAEFSDVLVMRDVPISWSFRRDGLPTRTAPRPRR